MKIRLTDEYLRKLRDVRTENIPTSRAISWDTATPEGLSKKLVYVERFTDGSRSRIAKSIANIAEKLLAA